MKKLLHERLRKLADKKNGDYYSSCVIKALCEEFGVCEDKSSYAVDLCNCLKAIADEIEKYYIPRPLFEDGEPVQFGDDTDELNGVEKFIFMRSCGGCCQMQDADGNMLTVFTGGFVKRPKPKVLDADGVEINVGDTVWSLNDSTKWKVTETHPTEPRISLRQLDTEKEVEGGWFLSSEYSLREPDSLEKVRDDIREYIAEAPVIDCHIRPWEQRLTALIERGVR